MCGTISPEPRGCWEVRDKTNRLRINPKKANPSKGGDAKPLGLSKDDGSTWLVEHVGESLPCMTARLPEEEMASLPSPRHSQARGAGLLFR